MTAFASRADHEGWVSGGSYWLPAYGSKNEFKASLADFAEAFNGKKLRAKERGDESWIIALVQKNPILLMADGFFVLIAQTTLK